jgi:uncharacterized protein (TIGR04168 family)
MKIAIVGDIHGHWDESDVRWFNESDRDAVLFTGDLAGFRHADTLRVARSIGGLEKPAFLVPGNHDTAPLIPFLAELSGQELLRRLSSHQGQRFKELTAALGPVQVGGFTRHTIGDVDLIVGRPHPMGGSELSFRRHIEAIYDVSNLEASARKLKGLVDASGDRVVFLAHNGPTGLGSSRTDIFGCDFRPEEGDWGDQDLRDAVDHARASGRTVLAVIAGHMHHELRGGGRRKWQAEQDGVLYVNAARVPRVFHIGGARRSRSMRHHVLLTIDGDSVSAEEVLT